MIISKLKLSNADIEKKANTDLENFSLKTGKDVEFPLYPEEIAKALWGIEVDYRDDLEDEVLGLFNSERQVVLINTSQNKLRGRLSFTIAHELGHVSLHGFLFNEKDKKKLSSINKCPRWLDDQADTYASCVLMPKEIMNKKLLEIGAIKDSVVNLKVHSRELIKFFGVSNQALEIRLSSLGLKIIGGLYDQNQNRNTERLLDELEGDREARILKKR